MTKDETKIESTKREITERRSAVPKPPELTIEEVKQFLHDYDAGKYPLRPEDREALDRTRTELMRRLAKDAPPATGTPRTDAELSYGKTLVSADFARQLETALAAANAELEKVKGEAEQRRQWNIQHADAWHYIGDMAGIHRLRPMEMAKQITETIATLRADLATATKERDEAREDALKAIQELTFLQSREEGLRRALEALLKRYVQLVESGDAGNWDAETEREVIAAKASLASPELAGDGVLLDWLETQCIVELSNSALREEWKIRSIQRDEMLTHTGTLRDAIRAAIAQESQP